MIALRRAFVALVPPPAALDHVEAAVVSLRDDWPSLRWTPRAQWHVTLQFLGHVDDADALVDSLRAGVSDVEPFPVRLGGGGAFARSRAGTVLWVGVDQGAAPMIALAEAVVASSATIGVEAEDRPFRAHLTVARAARPTDLQGAVSALDAAGRGPGWSAAEIVLFDSDTRSTGALHSVVTRISLGR